jgi:hypothetical protein
MRKIICLLISISFVFVLGSCSLIGTGSTTTSGPVSSGYPDSVVYKIKISNETYLCSSFNVNTTDAGTSLLLKDVYSMVSDGKITWVGQEKVVSVVTIEKISK